MKTYLVMYSVTDCEHSPEWHSVEIEAASESDAMLKFEAMNLYHFETEVKELVR